ncbi:hypothetical protein H8790_09555 [Oscillibacter hominis]|uniref:Uncharacterized protein n=1 Tax=Oscillibacter hominis TaxID=2763056 RepID=A0A7G9B2D0_9FIRM|nr:hypothetical protein [Oscillibacter hominis]QNL43711.1 hypothetical protein H8790_09555 [Oscillibacter hominis]
MNGIDELRPVTAAQLLKLRRDPLLSQCAPEESGLLGNALVLSKCCYQEGKPAFECAAQVMETLTAEQIERLIRLLCAGEQPRERPLDAGKSAAFDQERFRCMQEETT